MDKSANVRVGALVSVALAGLLLLTASDVEATDGTWNGTVDAAWAGANWSASPVPGTGNTATFNNSGNGRTLIDLGGGVTIGNVTFDTASAAAYSIGSGAVGSQSLTLNDNGAIMLNATVAMDQLFNCALVLGVDATAQAYSIWNTNATHKLTFAGGISGGSSGTAGIKTLTVTASAAGGGVVISGNISNGGAGAVALTKNGAGPLTLTGANTYTGATSYIDLGLNRSTNSITLAGNGSLGSSVSMLSVEGTRCVFNIQDSAVATFGTIYVGCNNADILNTINQSGGIMNYTGTGTGGSSGLRIGTMGTAAGYYNLSGGTLNATNGDMALGFGGSVGAFLQSGGTADLKGLYLGNSGNETGTLMLIAGALNLGADGIAKGSATANVNFQGGMVGAFADWSSSLPISLSNTTTVNTADARNGVTARAITLSGNLSGNGSLTKIGGGTLILSGTNTYTGATMVSNGTLAVTTALSLPTNSALTVWSNAVVNLGGTTQSVVSVGGLGSVSNGWLNVTSAIYPGGPNGVGTLTVTNLTLAEGCLVDWNHSVTTTDLVNVTGMLTLPASATVNITGTGDLPARVTIFSAPMINGATDLSGWTITGSGVKPSSRAKVSGTEVVVVTGRGTLLTVR